jgi:hypothetical protein
MRRQEEKWAVEIDLIETHSGTMRAAVFQAGHIMVNYGRGHDVRSNNTKENKETVMSQKKRYEVKGKCPQCACGSIYHLTFEEIEAKTIDQETIELSCPECGQVHREQVKSACPEYAKECHL